MGALHISPQAGIALGVLVGLASTSVQSVGLTLQRKSHILEDEKAEYDALKRPAYRRRRWQIGMLMFISANLIGSSVQITTLPLPVLSTLQASGLVFNTLCATLLLHEPFTRFSLIGTLLVTAGAVLIALFGAIPEPAHDLEALLVLLRRPAFLAWLICTLLVTTILLIFSRLSRHILSRPVHTSPRVKLARALSFAASSGILSAHTLLLAKSAVELLVKTLAPPRTNQFTRYESWLILVAVVILALSQLYCLHRGLKLASTSVLYPFVFCVYNVVAILDGLIYFDQVPRLAVLHAWLIALGTVILLAGVVALSWRLEHTSAPGTRPPNDEVGTPSAKMGKGILVPGMGFVDAVDDDDGYFSDEMSPGQSDESDSDTSRPHDEEAGTFDPPARRPLLHRPKTIATGLHSPGSPADALSPGAEQRTGRRVSFAQTGEATSTEDVSRDLHRPRRRATLSLAERQQRRRQSLAADIWDDLHDEAGYGTVVGPARAGTLQVSASRHGSIPVDERSPLIQRAQNDSTRKASHPHPLAGFERRLSQHALELSAGGRGVGHDHGGRGHHRRKPSKPDISSKPRRGWFSSLPWRPWAAAAAPPASTPAEAAEEEVFVEGQSASSTSSAQHDEDHDDNAVEELDEDEEIAQALAEEYEDDDEEGEGNEESWESGSGPRDGGEASRHGSRS